MNPSLAKKKRKSRVVDDDEDYTSDGEEPSIGAEELSREESETDEQCNEASTSKQSVPSRGPFLPFERDIWSPLYLYRTMADLTVAAIRQSGNEGIGRIEVGQTYGVDTRTKSGNRRVSTHILNALKAFPDYFGQFQKMEGKFRCIKYYWKVASRPENFNKLFSRWENIVGAPCPFKMGQVIKFPGTKLSTLRVSDVTLRRLIDIMDLVTKHRIIVTMSRFVKMLIEVDKAHGCKYQIDKKSIMKCLLALQKQNLVKVFDTVVMDESVKNTIQLVCESTVTSPTNPEVLRAIRIVIDEFHENGRVFPHGQLRYSKKEGDKTQDENAGSGKDCDEELAHLENELDDLTIDKRMSLLRLQNARTTSIVQPSTNSAEEDLKAPQAKKKEKTEVANFISPMSAKKALRDQKISQRIDIDVAYGRQSKWNRCLAIHKLAYHFVHGSFQRKAPNLFERFPPGKPWTNIEGTPLEECPVYLDEESPYRFVPPMPQFSGVPRGWFMLQDLLNVFPLSIYALMMKRKAKCAEVEDYLKDPIRRHMLLNDLPRQIRLQLLNDKILLRQLEHHLLTLCGLGLARLGRGANPRKVLATNSQFYFITKSGMLRDTSTSEEGYANVKSPIEQYDVYHYSFHNLEDVEFFWHHLRAIALSTKLAYKLLAGSEDPSRFKKYAVGSFDKSHIYKSYDDLSEVALPAPPYDGCAGFDSAFFIHLKRHWDLNVRPPEYVDWFVAEWRRSVERVKPEIEKRVRRLERAWNSYLKSLLPTDSWVWKINKVKDTVLRPSHKLRAVERKGKIRKRIVPREAKKGLKTGRGKRVLDELDVLSTKSRLHFRSRFTSRERDMLLLIRAVGFFLNPVYRFWLDPAVLRDIMHAYVPESRNKTVQSLMAAGVREMVRPQRIGLLRQIVKNLASFQEMRELRSDLASSPNCGAIEKRQFFYKAFEAANRNLAMEAKGVPAASVPDSVFNEQLIQNGVKITSEMLRSTPFPARSSKPINIEQIRHCVAFNVVTGMLLSEKDLNDSRMDAIVEQVSACSLSSVLEQLRIDGLLARLRMSDDISVSGRGQTVLSYYFRHFFNHRFHSDIVEMSNDACKHVCSNPFTDENNPGIIVSSLSAFSGKVSLDLTVPESVIDAFEQASAEVSAQDEKQTLNATKQLRSLEKTDLRIENMEVLLSKIEESEPLPDVIQLLESLSTAIPLESLGAVVFEDFILNYPVSQRALLRSIYSSVKEAGIVGASVDEIMEKTKVSEEQLDQILQELTSAAQLFAVGVDCYRYVTPADSTCWLLHNEKVAFFPTPWMVPSGEVYYPTVRWMSEGVLFAIVDKPGISMKDLRARFAFALQPRMLLDLVNLLSKCGCVNIVRQKRPSCRLLSPFSSDPVIDIVEYVEPTVNAMQLYSKLFGPVKLSNMLAGFRSEVTDA